MMLKRLRKNGNLKAAIMTAFNAFLVLLTTFGVPLSQEQSAALIGAVNGLLLLVLTLLEVPIDPEERDNSSS
jgi:L-lactate permease